MEQSYFFALPYILTFLCVFSAFVFTSPSTRLLGQSRKLNATVGKESEWRVARGEVRMEWNWSVWIDIGVGTRQLKDEEQTGGKGQNEGGRSEKEEKTK